MSRLGVAGAERAARSLLGLAACLAMGSSVWAEDIQFGLPLACVPGETCFIQHYVDQDSGSGARDYACGSRTYDGHNGTDFRIRSRAEARGRPGTVLAVAAGSVLRGRSDMADGTMKGPDAGDVTGQECGNGLVIAHEGGWESQYCHLAHGTLTVRPGERVAAGQALGQVGLSGKTEFPHLHLTLRRNGTVVDPFAPQAEDATCDRAALAARAMLWDAPARAALTYQAGSVLNSGFTDGPVDMEALEQQTLREPDAKAGAIVAYIRAIGLDTGDVQTLRLTAPDGSTLAERVLPPLERPRAQSLIFVGRRVPAGGWPPGPYRARFTVARGTGIALASEWSWEPSGPR